MWRWWPRPIRFSGSQIFKSNLLSGSNEISKPKTQEIKKAKENEKHRWLVSLVGDVRVDSALGRELDGAGSAHDQLEGIAQGLCPESGS